MLERPSPLHAIKCGNGPEEGLEQGRSIRGIHLVGKMSDELGGCEDVVIGAECSEEPLRQAIRIDVQLLM